MLLECGEGAVLEPWQPDVLTLGWAKANKTASFLLVQKATLGATGLVAGVYTRFSDEPSQSYCSYCGGSRLKWGSSGETAILQDPLWLGQIPSGIPLSSHYMVAFPMP